jgi:aspartyl-tRNA(Asn)/glutamyl-tRNA(Gln) amidotransferase subunit B
VQETRRWEDAKGSSFSMRSKEDAVDYRYFPEPDMPVLKIDPNQGLQLLARPYEYIKTCKNDFGFNKEFINALLLDKALFDFFFAQVEKGFDAKTVAKWIVGPMKWALDYVQGDETNLLKSLSDEAKKLGITGEELLEKKTKFLKSCT